jgi:hypothetical protein
MFKFEFRRLIYDRKNIYFFFIIMVAALYFTNSGIREYHHMQKEKALFLNVEKEMVKQFADYKQYSGYGFRVFFEPSPLFILFYNSTILLDIEGRIDNSELLKIYNQFKGKKLFYNRGYFKDFSGFIYFTGSLLMIYMGMVAFRSLERLKFELQFISLGKLFALSTAARLFYLNLFFILVMTASQGFSYISGILFNPTVFYHSLAFLLYTLVLLNFFYFVGLLVSVILRFGPSSFLWMFILWVFFIFLAPDINRLFLSEEGGRIPSNAKIDLLKVKAVQGFEKQATEGYNAAKGDSQQKENFYRKTAEKFLENTHMHNKSLEEGLSDDIKRTLFSYERRSLMFPYLYYFFLSAELSSKGYYNYLDLKEHMITTHNEFLRFFFEKYYFQKKTKVKNYVQKGENLFVARSYLPRTFWWAFGVAFYYCLLLAGAAFYLLKRLVYPND